MKRQGIFSFRVSNDERQMISILATHLHRSESDAVRYLVINMVGIIKQNYRQENPHQYPNEIEDDDYPSCDK